MGDQLLPLPLTVRSIHLYVDRQRIFSAEGPRPTPSRDKVLPVATTLAHRHRERTIFTRFIPPEPPIGCRAFGSATTRAGVLRPASASISSCWT
jgi:nicotinamidase-related amidase